MPPVSFRDPPRTRARSGFFLPLVAGVAFILAGVAAHPTAASAATTKYWIGPAGGNFSSNSNWSTTSGGANDTTAPGSADVATFDSGGNTNATLDTTVNVAGISIASTYTATITQGAGVAVTVGTSNYSQAGGTFTGSAADITINGTFSLSGGTFTATSGTTAIGNATSIDNTFFAQSGGTFTHNNGSVTLDPGGSDCGSVTSTIDVTTSITFNNLELNRSGGECGGDNITVASGDTLIVNGTYTQRMGNGKSLNGGTIEVKGAVIVADNNGSGGGSGTAKITFTGTTNQEITTTGASGGTSLPQVNIDKLSGAVSLASGSTDLSVSIFTLTQGSFVAPSGTFSVGRGWSTTATIFSVASGATFTHNSGTVAFIPYYFSTATYTVDVNTTLTLNNVNIHLSQQGGGGVPVFTTAFGDTVIVAGTFTHTDGAVNGAWEVQGNVTIGIGADGGTATLSFTGTANQTFANSGGTNPTGSVTINKSSGTVTLASAATWNAASQNVTLTAGTLNLAGYVISTNTITTAFGSTMQLQGAETITAGTKTFNAATNWTFTGNGNALANTYTITNYATTMGTLTINSTDGATDTFALGVALTLSGNFTNTAGTFDVSATNYGLSVGGNFSNSGTFTARSGTVTLTGTGAYTLEPGGTTFSDLTLNNGLVGYWKLDEGTSNKARDSSGNGNVGTLTNGPTWSTSAPSRMQFYDPKSLHFDGVNDYVDLGTSASIRPTGSMTLCGWSYLSHDLQYVISNTGNNGAYGYDLARFPADIVNERYRFSIAITASTQVVLQGSLHAGASGGWFHSCGVYDATAQTMQLYVNGTLEASATSSDGVPASQYNQTAYGNPKIGANGQGNGFGKGFIDDVRIYNRALSASEIKALYNGSKSTGSGTYTLGSTLTVNSALSIYAGTLDVSGSNYAVNVAGNLDIEGDLTPRNGTVTLNGTGNQTVSGSTMFWNLTKSVSAAAALFLDYTARQSASGALTLQGTAGNLLSLRSTRSGSGARLLLDGDSGTQTLTYLDVKDSDASGGAVLSCLNCTDSGNNTNWTFTTSSNNAYVLSPDTMNSGGGEVAKSDHYILQDSIGEPIVGFGATANYILNSGYRQPASQNVVSFSCASSLNLGSVVTTGQKTGSGSCTIVTDDATGYNLSWTIRAGSGGVNTGSLISQYNDLIGPFAPSVADTPDTWSVAAPSAAWGARLSSRSTDTRAEWGTDGVSDKWLNVAALTTRTIISRASPSTGVGSTEIIQFRSEVGSSAFKPTGTYRATVTLTAVTL